jgi:ribose transport system permease protein
VAPPDEQIVTASGSSLGPGPVSTPPTSQRPWAPIIGLMRRYSFALALILTVVLLIVNILTESGSFGLTAQLANLAPMAIAAMASTPSIVSGGGGFDLTISPAMTFLGGAAALWLIPHGLGGVVIIPILLGMGAAIGALNGLLIMLLRIPPVVATLSMYFVFLGVDLEMAPTPLTIQGGWFTHLSGSVGPIPGAVFTIGAPLLIWFLLGLTPFRRTLFAVGSNAPAAFSAGVNVALVRVLAYSLGGLFAAIGGIALLSLVLTVNASSATDYTLLAVASVALGGTPLAGGRGGLFGGVLGAASIYLLGNILIILQINPSWLQVVYGGMLVLAVVLSGSLSSSSRGTK